MVMYFLPIEQLNMHKRGKMSTPSRYSFNPGIVKEREDRFNLKSPTLFIFAEKDAVIPLDQVRAAQDKLLISRW